MSTENRRIYAIGDIHGCLGALTNRWADIHADLAARPHPSPLVIFLGDYTDRGPSSRDVLDQLITYRDQPDIETIFLFGNHDKQFLDYLQDPLVWVTDRYHWFHTPLGGAVTLASYGVANASPEDPAATHAEFVKRVPQPHIDFLKAAQLTHQLGKYLFVHAGIRPGIPLAEQDPNDLIWIRSPFLEDPGDHGHIVVHGHTVVEKVEHHGNRIAIDTGAVFGGTLSCLVLEAEDINLLQDGGLSQLR